MNPNQGREAAYVTSRVKDLSNVPASTEYLPLFTCLTPKGNSTEPVLIRDVETLVEEFGDPSLNPDAFCDLLTIKDFVKGRRSCWVNRIDVSKVYKDYLITLYNTIPVGIKQWFYYKNWDNLTEEQKDIVNCGWNGQSGTLTFIDETGKRTTIYDLGIYSFIELVRNRDLLLERTGWEMREYPTNLSETTVFHNHNQDLSVNNKYNTDGGKYIIVRQQCTYHVDEDKRLIFSEYSLKLKEDGTLYRNSAGETVREPLKVIPVIKQDDHTYIKKEVGSASNIIFIVDKNADVYVRLVGNRLYTTRTRASNYYVDEDFNMVDVNGNYVYSLGSYRGYVDDKCISEYEERTLIDGEDTVDISFYKPSTYYNEYIQNSLRENGVFIDFPEGYPVSSLPIGAVDHFLEKNPIDPKLFYVSSLLYQYGERYYGENEGLIAFTSVRKLVPSSAGWTINYVVQGSLLGGKYAIIEDSLSLPEFFTDQQFIDQLNKNPYLEATAIEPESDNLYKFFSRGKDLQFVYSVLLTQDEGDRVIISADSYADSIRKYADPKYNGCLIGDLAYPEFDYRYRKVEMSTDDRKMIQWVIKDVACQRKDLTCIFTTPDLPLNDACNWVAARGEYSGYYEYGNTQALDYSEQSFYCEMYHGWMSYKTALVNGQPYKIDKVPPTVFVIGNIIDAWKTKGISFPVAGDQGGILNSSVALVNVKDNPDTKSKRDKLVSYRINPIWDTGLRGIQIYGNETLNPQYTDLSAAHIARMLVQIRSQVDRYSETIKFKLNDQFTWGGWINYVSTKILEPLKAAGGLIWYSVKMGLDTTPRELIAQRKIKGIVGLQFAPDLEIVDLEFVVYASSLEIG